MAKLNKVIFYLFFYKIVILKNQFLENQTVNSCNNIAPVNPVSVITVQSKETIENTNEINKPQTIVEMQEETKMDVKENLPSELKIEKEEENEIPAKEEDYTFKVDGYNDEENLWYFKYRKIYF